MNNRMITRDSKATVLEISKAMTDWKISSIAITDEKSKQVIGILTERDVVKLGIATVNMAIRPNSLVR
jgi:CBS domain-containing protein